MIGVVLFVTPSKFEKISKEIESHKKRTSYFHHFFPLSLSNCMSKYKFIYKEYNKNSMTQFSTFLPQNQDFCPHNITLCQ